MTLRNIRRKRSKKTGQTTVEFALCIPIFLFMAMAMVDLGMYVFVEANMSRIVRESARYAVTGNTDLSSNGNWSDAVFQSANNNNRYSSYIELTPTVDSFLIRDLGNGVDYPATFPRGSRVGFRITQEFKYFTPFLKLLEGSNRQFDIVVETIYQMEQ